MHALLLCKPAKDRDHLHVYFLFCRLSLNEDLKVCEKKGPSHVNLNFVMFKQFKKSLPLEKQFQAIPGS